MKVAVLADGQVGERIGRWLINEHADDICILVAPRVNPLVDFASSKGVNVQVASSNQQVLQALQRCDEIDYGFMLWWPSLVKEDVLSLAKHGFINTHPSLLPHGRGKHYNFWTIVEQAPFGVSLHMVETGIDSGAIVAQREISYDWCDTGQSLYHKAQLAMYELFVDTYPELMAGNVIPVPQDLEQGSLHYAKELDPASLIDLDQQYTARDLINLLRARTFFPYPACRFVDNGELYEVRVEISKKI